LTDYLILGGGSAGCVLAARLTEDNRNRVTLVEAGLLRAIPCRWPSLTAKMGAAQGNSDNRSGRRYEQGRVLGGGSAVNAMVANRGGPSDYDEWGQAGAEGWSW
jgi:5-(hydroxymethyl)furfural/furfural oxidase